MSFSQKVTLNFGPNFKYPIQDPNYNDYKAVFIIF